VIPVQTLEIGIDQLAGAVRAGAAVIDVREPHEYVAGHVPGAVLIPMGQLPGRIAELNRRAPVYVVCASGNRSATMTGFLRAAGFDADSVAGGTGEWARSGRPVVGGHAPRA
jgi:rhodanese-related sulfurtransferase